MKCDKFSLLLVCLVLFFTSCKAEIVDISIPTPIFPPVVPPTDTTHSKPGDGVYYTVMSRSKEPTSAWKSYTAKTVDHLLGFSYSQDPATGTYGGWKVNKSSATGFYRSEKIGNRWWIIDPEGYPFIHKAVAEFKAGASPIEKSSLINKFGTDDNLIKTESQTLRSYGFNGTGAWSDADRIKVSEKPLAYTVIVFPMAAYRSEHIKKYGGNYPVAGYKGYRYDLVMCFDDEFDKYIESTISVIAKYKDDKNLVGYFTDNELPWVNVALDNHLKFLDKTEQAYIVVKKWFDERKGKDATVADITAEDRLAFSAFYFETYMRKVTAAIRKYDPNHMYLGQRFNTWAEELSNPEIFRIAGQYMDVISINHYGKWEPDQTVLTNWSNWSGKPFMITEFYTKGEDSGLANTSGGGFVVATQKDRGLCYQNFVIELLKSKSCVGWHWFKYQDNDPDQPNANPSNIDANKGIVTREYVLYQPLVDNMKMINEHVYELSKFFDK